MKNKTLQLLTYNLMILVSYTIIGIVLYTLFDDSIYIETHINKKVLYLAGGILAISIIIASVALSKVLGEKIYESIMRFTLLIFMSIFSLNIISLFKMSIKILGFNDIIYQSKFITIYYKYNKKELLIYVSKYYEELTGGDRILTMKEKLKVLGDAKTIAEVRTNIEKYYNLELNSWSTKFYKIFTTCTEWCLEHPYVAGAAILGISTGIFFPLIRNIYNQYNIYKMANSVSALNESVTTLSSENQSLFKFLIRLESAVSALNENNIKILSVITDYFNFNASAIPSFGLSERQQITYVHHMGEFQKRLANVETPLSIVEIKKEPIENRIIFTQGHILGGTATRSRLIEPLNNNN